MSAQIIPFTAGALPAHLLNQFELTDDLSRGVSAGGFPTISILGKEFAVVRGGVRTPITRMNGDGEEEVARYIDVVILRANPEISKVFYEGSYSEGSDAKPTCYSPDGTTPAEDAAAPQAKTCAVCPHNQWGSRITESGGKAKACADSRRLAVSALTAVKDPMLLRVPGSSLKELDKFNKVLEAQSTPYPAVLTRIGFQSGVPYPSLTFKPVAFIDATSAQQVLETRDTPLVHQIIGVQAAPAPATDSVLGHTRVPSAKVATLTPAIKAPQSAPEPESEPVAVAPTPATPPKAKPKPVIEVESADDGLASALSALVSGDVAFDD